VIDDEGEVWAGPWLQKLPNVIGQSPLFQNLDHFRI